MKNLAAIAALCLPLACLLPGAVTGQDQEGGPREAITAALAAEGVHIDFEHRAVRVGAQVLVRGELLEYLLVGPGGAAHESLFVTDVVPNVINTALLALGAEQGKNAQWIPVEPPPTLEERRAGKAPFTIVPPSGDGFYLYAAWREGDETFFFRIEDLVANLDTGRSMRRHRWVYLGSKFLTDRDGNEVFAADAEQNLVNVSFFRAGHTLLTPSLPECIEQSIWVANAWLVPPREAAVELVFAREPLAALPPEWEESLPVVVAPEAPEDGR